VTTKNVVCEQSLGEKFIVAHLTIDCYPFSINDKKLCFGNIKSKTEIPILKGLYSGCGATTFLLIFSIYPAKKIYTA
jgi:hypothetical protein